MQVTLSQLATVTLDGTAQRIHATQGTLAQSVVIQADDGNAGKVVVGDSAVAVANGVELAAGEALTIKPGDVNGTAVEIDLYDIFVRGAAADTVRISYIKRK